MKDLLLFLLYCLIVVFWLNKAKKLQSNGLTSYFLIGYFFLRLGLGFLYYEIYFSYFTEGDTFILFDESKLISSSFFNYPEYYFRSIFGLNPIVPSDAEVFLYPSTHFILKDFGTYLLVHLHAFPVWLSNGSYHVHLIFVSIIGLLASVNVYNAFKVHFSDNSKLHKLSCFFIPSIIFWTSGFHKDVWVYLGISYLLLGLNEIKNTKINKHLLVGLLIVTLFRFHLFLIILPLLVAYFWSLREDKITALQKYVIVTSFFFILIFIAESTGFIPILKIISNKQIAFLNEYGSSNIENASALKPTFLSVIQSIPGAFINVCFRPFIWDCKDFLQYLASVELLLFWLGLLFYFIYSKTPFSKNPLQLFISFYFLLNFLMIGLLVNNVGTIARYRAIAMGLVAIFVLQAMGIVKKEMLKVVSTVSPLKKTEKKLN